MHHTNIEQHNCLSF